MAATTIEEAIHDILVTDSSVKAITTRCYPSTLPQNPTYPLILYAKVTGERINDLSGPSGMAHPRFQIEAWAETYAAAKSLANAIRVCLNGYRGTSGTVRIGSFLIQSERDIYEPEAACHRVVMDYAIWHNE
jgi:hypothetical protein